MKNIGICAIFVILIVFCSPLLEIKDNYKNMEYEAIGDTMLNNIEPFLNKIDDIADLANKAVDFISDVLEAVKKGIDYIGKILTSLYNILPSWLKGEEEKEMEIICTEGANGEWYCQYEDGTPYYGENNNNNEPCTGLYCDI